MNNNYSPSILLHLFVYPRGHTEEKNIYTQSLYMCMCTYTHTYNELISLSVVHQDLRAFLLSLSLSFLCTQL